ncbi:MAG: hypothetical protein ACRDRX_13670 [Pseudonocardiaceae bacterium]
MADHEPMTEGGCPEPEPSQELRDALTLLSEHSDNPDFRTLIDDVLAGRRSLIDASATAAFSDVVFAGLTEEFARLTDEDKQRLAGQAQTPPPEGETGSCGLPCASCSGICAALRAHPDR